MTYLVNSLKNSLTDGGRLVSLTVTRLISMVILIKRYLPFFFFFYQKPRIPVRAITRLKYIFLNSIFKYLDHHISKNTRNRKSFFLLYSIWDRLNLLRWRNFWPDLSNFKEILYKSNFPVVDHLDE